MSAACDRCPCPGTCLRYPGFCRWAAEEPPDPVKLQHIRDRSAQGPSRPVPVTVYYGTPAIRGGGCCGG